MIAHRCDGCRRRFSLEADLDPFLCEECSAILCATCELDGCCRAVLSGGPCSDCDGAGWSNPGGPCSNCCGTCVVRRPDGAQEECPTCAGSGQGDFRRCLACDGFGYPEARRLQRRVA